MTLDSKTCQACGLCCTSPYVADYYVGVTALDQKRLGEKIVRLHVVEEHDSIRVRMTRTARGPLAGVTFNKCVLLKGSVGHAVACSVYETRPEICKTALVPGDDTCLFTRRTWGYEDP